jgi:activator of HSP90 ATPase
MAKTIIQKISFKNATPDELFNLYMNPKKHTAVTGAEAKISAKEGAEFSSYDGYDSGTNLKLVKNSLIVNSWRASDWDASTPDSQFMLFFEPRETQTLVHMVHSNLPDDEADSLAEGWHDFYWEPWKAYLAKKAKG